MRTLLQADGSYLILSDFDTDVSEFARSLDIQLLTLKQLQEWEVAIPVPPDLWPCRSEYLSYDTARKNWKKLSSGKETDPDWRLLREILSFIEIDSWLTFRYRNLNKLLRLIVALAEEYPKVRSDLHRELCSRYVFSALIVRFCQYLLDVCYDLTRIPTTEIAGYLQQRLTFGDQDPERAGKLIEATVDWIRQSLKKHGIALPPEVDVGRLYESPSYAGEFVELTNRLIRKSNEARYLPIAMEVSQFGSSEVLAKFPRLRAAASAGETLAAMVKGFVNRTFSIPKELTKPIADQLKATYHSTSGQLSKSREGATQLHLEGEDK